jgi:predicted DNA-binding protein
MRTIAIRCEDELHSVLTLLAQLSGRPLVEEIREALDAHISRKRSEVDLTAQAEKALAEIDRDTVARRAAIESLLEGKQAGGEAGPKRRKGGRPAGDA